MTISAEHRKRLRALHERDSNFGVIGYLWRDRVIAYMEATNSKSLLDYGCGRSNLASSVANKSDVVVREYEPAFDKGVPMPADFVTCIDVMEHVEEDQVVNVLEDIKRCANNGALITISLRNCTKKNAKTHPMAAKPREFWAAELHKVFVDSSIEEVRILNPAKAKSEAAFLIVRNFLS